MSTNFVLVVLAPNGRRETVKVTPNTSILQVLEDVCTKQQLNSNEWDLKHYNRIVELANSVRFSGLANNATLEMVQSHKPRVENLVKLGLQLESGKRLMHQFSPHQTLWEVLVHWESAGEVIFPEYSEAEELISTQPVCIYMRQEVVGKDQLQEKTLRSLGLTHGSAIVRLVHRSESQLRHQANVSAPLSRQTTSQVQIPQEVSHSSKSDDWNEESWESPVISNQGHTLGSGTIQAPAPSVSTSASEPMSHLSVTELEKPVPVATANSTVTPMEEGRPASADIAENRRKIAVDGQLHILGDHDAILYFADDVSRPTSSVSIPDDFYDVTTADVTAMYRDLQERRIQMENAPLQTSSARSLERDTVILRNLRDHPVTIVRIRFSDRYVLQGKFRTVDTIAAIENFVKQFLANPDLPFYLFTTPPKTILPSTNRLVEENLIGSAVIYFGTEGKIDQILNPDLYELVSCPEAVQEYIRTNSEEGNPKPPIDQTTLNMADGQQPSSSHQQPSSSGPSTSIAHQRPALNPGSSRLKDGKVPKWFKASK